MTKYTLINHKEAIVIYEESGLVIANYNVNGNCMTRVTKRMPLIYPCIICFNSEHHARDCPRKTKVHNMIQTKLTATVILVTKNPELENVPVHVVVITTRNQVPEQQVLRERESVKAKATTNGKHKNNCMIFLFILLRSYKGVI